MLKKLIALSCCAFITNVYALPNTFTIKGHFINNATQDITPPGWNYITNRITVSNPNDLQYITIAGQSMPSNGTYFDLYYNDPVEYVIDTSHLSSYMTVEYYDPNTNYKCAWRFAHNDQAATLLSGDPTVCKQTAPDNDLIMNKRN